MLLADLGADVVKIEPPEGDATRGWGPPWVGRAEDGTRTAAYYLAVNRNKRSIRLDLKQPAGADVLRRLLADADVFVENLRPDSLDRLGFDDAALAAINPRLIHLAITGYGPSGPLVGRPGYDFVIQAEAGLMSITGAADADGGGPTKVGVAIADVADRAPRRGRRSSPRSPAASVRRRPPTGPASGSTCRSSNRRCRSSSTRPRTRSSTASPPGRLGNAHPNIVPYETFETADGEIAVAVGSERQWPRFCRALGLPALADDPRFATNGDRVDEPGRADRDAARALRRAGVRGRGSRRSTRPTSRPARSTTSPTAFASPQAVARQMAVEVEHPALGRTTQVGSAVRAVGDAGVDPDGAAAARRALGRDPRRGRLRRAPRSRRSAPAG